MKIWFFISLLLAVNLAAASFMIHESAGYYMMLYGGEAILIPWGAAILAEVFQHILMIVKGDSTIQDGFIKSLAIGLFFLTVTGAGYKVYKPIELAAEKNTRQSELISILKQEVEDNRKDLNAFLEEENRQKTNAAIAVRERRKATRELKQTLKKDPEQMVDSVSNFEIVHMFLLRVAIQMAALFCAWKIGSIYRSQLESKPSGRKIIKRWKAKHLRADQGFVGIVQYSDGSFLSVSQRKRKSYKTFNGAVQFFNGTKYEGKIPVEPTEVSI